MQTDSAGHRQAIQKSKETTARNGVLSGACGVGLSIVLAVTANSVAMVADMFSTLLEFLSVFIAWLTLRLVKQKKTETFNYGLGKIENISSLIIALFMFVSLCIIAFTCVLRLQHPVPLAGFGVWLGIVLHSLFGCINVSLWLKSRGLATAAPSPMIDAQARLFCIKSLNNIMILSLLVLGVSFRENPLVYYLDPVVSIVIAAAMIFSGYAIIRNSMTQLLDLALEESLQLVILKVLAKHYDDYEQFREQRSRRSGQHVFIELFLEFAPERSMGEVGRAAARIQADLEAAITDSCVLIIPISTQQE